METLKDAGTAYSKEHYRIFDFEKESKIGGKQEDLLNFFRGFKGFYLSLNVFCQYLSF